MANTPHGFVMAFPPQNANNMSSGPDGKTEVDYTVREKWDSGNEFGCCANGRGCQGCLRLLYTNSCLCCVQSTVAQKIKQLKGRKVWDPRSISGIKSSSSRNTKKSEDNASSLIMMAHDLQDEFEMEDQIDECKLTALSYACPSCLLTWMWHTAMNMEEKAMADRRQKKREA